MGEQLAPFSTSTSNEPPGLLLLGTFSGGPPSNNFPAPLGEALGEVEFLPASSLERSLCTCRTGIQPHGTITKSSTGPAGATVAASTALLVSGARNFALPPALGQVPLLLRWGTRALGNCGCAPSRADSLSVRAVLPLSAQGRSAVELAVEDTSEVRPEIAWRRLCAGAGGGGQESIPGCAGASLKSHSSWKNLQLAMGLESAQRAARKARLEPLRPRQGPWPHVRAHGETRRGSVTVVRAHAADAESGAVRGFT